MLKWARKESKFAVNDYKLGKKVSYQIQTFLNLSYSYNICSKKKLRGERMPIHWGNGNLMDLIAGSGWGFVLRGFPRWPVVWLNRVKRILFLFWFILLSSSLSCQDAELPLILSPGWLSTVIGEITCSSQWKQSNYCRGHTLRNTEIELIGVNCQILRNNSLTGKYLHKLGNYIICTDFL